MSCTRCFLVIAFSVASLGSAAPAAAFSHASTTVKAVEVPRGPLPLPLREPKLRALYCASYNCLMPPPRPGR